MSAIFARIATLAASMLATASVFAAGAPPPRQAVLNQIDAPHDYYFREMYLPQLTTGPGSVAWMPDGASVVYSMAGTLWRQAIASGAAEQLTDGPGYDYEPDVAPDGSAVVFVRYSGRAIEIERLDLATRKVTALTANGAVNVDPRIAPDGKHIAFVSTALTHRFKLVLADFDGRRLGASQLLIAERRSAVPRYYYSAFDQELSPDWTPDGRALVLVSNREIGYGSGAIWRLDLGDRQTTLMRDEETSWRARPAVSPDGSRILYASYAGRQWHQLMLAPIAGGVAVPISYGEFDNTGARFSPDGGKLALISNRDGNTSLWLADVATGRQSPLVADTRRFLNPRARLAITVKDEHGNVLPARISVTGADGRAYAPDDAWMHADDSLVPAQQSFEAHYFHAAARVEVNVPAGTLSVSALHGFRRSYITRTLRVEPGEQRALELVLPQLSGADEFADWLGGDVHVHMNYGGNYRQTPAGLARQAAAEDLDVVHNLIVNKEQRVPDIGYFSPAPDAISNAHFVLAHGQEFHTSYWGHLGILAPRENVMLPGYAAYPGTAAASLWPSNAAVADAAHAQGALVGYVHPFDSDPDPAKDATLTNELPIDVALGKVDYYEVVGFSDHRASEHVWQRLLNLGFRLPAAAGTDAMTNYASLRGPVGMNRTFVHIDGGVLDRDTWLAALKAGRSFASNGPLVDLRLDDARIGDSLQFARAGVHAFHAAVASIVPLDHVEIVFNGRVLKALDPQRVRSDGKIDIAQSGWLTLRAYADGPHLPVLDRYPFAETAPIYVDVAAVKSRAPADAGYFLAWIGRIETAANAHPDYRSPAERATLLGQIERARKIFEGLQ